MILIARLGGALIIHYVIIQKNLHNYYDILTMHFLNSLLIRILHANLYNHYDITIFYSLLLRLLHLLFDLFLQLFEFFVLPLRHEN